LIIVFPGCEAARSSPSISTQEVTMTVFAPLRTSALLVAVVAGTAFGGAAPAAQDNVASTLLTRAEQSGFRETSRYDEVMAVMQQAAAASDRIHLTEFGYTNEGRALPLAVVGDVGSASADDVRASGKLRVYLQGNIHAGEVCGKEALQMLLREIAGGEHAAWFDSVVLLVAPIYNADGNERIALSNRPGQNGPIGGMGQRPNAQGLDLNRDHMKAESPEARSLLGLMREYDPQVAVDLHTTNGTRHAYHLTYSPPLNPNTDPAIDSLLRGDWLPWLTETIRGRHGEEHYYYGNLPYRGGIERGWYTFDHRPRFNNNYVGLRNRIAILSEAYAYASFEQRVMSSLYFTRAIVDYAAAHADDIAELVRQADATPVIGDELAVRSQFARSPEPVEILLGEVEVAAHPYTGRRMARRIDTVIPESMHEYGSFTATATETVPEAYLVPAELAAVLDRLAVHGIVTAPLPDTTTLMVERFAIASTSQSEREFQGHRERTLEGRWEAAELTVPAGTVRVDMNQPLARLAFTLLEPRSDDGLANWNLLDEALADNEFYPILRLPARR